LLYRELCLLTASSGGIMLLFVRVGLVRLFSRLGMAERVKHY